MTNAGEGLRVQVDKTKINGLFDALNMSNKEARKATRRALTASINVIRNEGRKNLSRVVNKDGSLLDAKNLRQFVRSFVYRDSNGATATILDDKRGKTNKRLAKKGMANKSYIVKFFEGGTAERMTKGHTRSGSGRGHITWSGKGGYRGKIGASHFFSNAVESKKKEAIAKMDASIIDYINKVVAKRK